MEATTLENQENEMAAPFNPSYTGPRKDILRLIPPEGRTILDVGCSNGTLGRDIKRTLNAKVSGVELDPGMAEAAAEQLDEVFIADAQSVFSQGLLAGRTYDVIIFADVLEHLVDPWAALTAARSYLSPNGVMIASIPNIRHMSTLFSLVFQARWPYRDRGIHDRTHLRFFTLKNIKELFATADLSIIKIRANYRVIETPHRLNFVARLLAIPPIRGFLAYQYLILAK